MESQQLTAAALQPLVPCSVLVFVAIVGRDDVPCGWVSKLVLHTDIRHMLHQSFDCTQSWNMEHGTAIAVSTRSGQR